MHPSPLRPRPLVLATFFAALASCVACTPTANQAGSDDDGTGGNRGTGGAGNGSGGAGSTSTSGGAPGSGGNGAAGASGGATGSGGAAATPGQSGGGSGSGGPGASGGADAGSNPGADAPVPPPASNGNCEAKLCDDFEGYGAGSVPAGSWKSVIRDGTLAVDEKKAFSGARSMQVTNTGASTAKTFIELSNPVLPLPNNVVYGRLMYYLTKAPQGTNSHFEIVRGSGLLAGGARAQFNTGGENGKVMINYEPNDCSKYPKTPLPEKKWTCYQWEFNGSKDAAGASKSEMRLWLDGVPVADATILGPAGNCWKAPMTFDTVHIGYQQYHGFQPVELWIDDVAVGDKPIPCPTGPASKP